MIIWGFKTYATVLAVANLVCQRCHNPAAHRLHQLRRKFTLFFIPLFPVSTSYLLDCTFCGLQSKLTKEQADALVTQHAQGQHGQVQPQPQPPASYGGPVGQGQPGLPGPTSPPPPPPLSPQG